MSNKALSEYTDFEIAEELTKRINEFDDEIEISIEAGRITWWRNDGNEEGTVDVEFGFFYAGDGTDDDGTEGMNGRFHEVGVGGSVSS